MKCNRCSNKIKDPVKMPTDISRQTVGYYNKCAELFGFDKI